MLQNRTVKRMIAWIAMVAVVFVMLFSVVYITQHADHDCTGAECPICAVMEQCGNNIKTIGTLLVLVVAAVFLCLSVRKCVQRVITVCADDSLISKKVRLNN